MAKERVDVLAFKQGLFETREQAKRGVMAGLVISVINGERYDKPGEKIDEGIELKLKGKNSSMSAVVVSNWRKPCRFSTYQLRVKQRLILGLQQADLRMLCCRLVPSRSMLWM